MFRVIATDNLSEAGLERLRSIDGIQLDVFPPLDPEDLKRELKTADAIIIRSATKLRREILEATDSLQLAIRAGVGVDNIDVPCATERGVLVSNTPRGNAATTAEHAFSLITALARNTVPACSSLKAGRWDKKRYVGTQLMGKTLGIVGLGNIGAHVARIARGYDMRVLASDPFLTDELAEQHHVEKVELDEILKEADIITIHCPKTPATTGLIGAGEFEKMKPTALVVNCARGGIVDEDALYDALKGGRIRGAALDVYTTEPLPEDHRLLELDNLVVTPHLGASTKEAQLAVAIEAAELLEEFMQKGSVRSAINSRIRMDGVGPAARDAMRLAGGIGAFHGQLHDGAPTRIEVEVAGEELTPHGELLLTSTAKTFLHSIFSKEKINDVNVGHYAKQRNIELVSSTREKGEGRGEVRVTVETKTESGTRRRDIRGTVVGPGDVRVTHIDGYGVDIVPVGHMLFIRNHDKPGVIGKVGTVLGTHGVNISRRGVTVSDASPLALGVICVDSDIPEAAISEIGSFDFVDALKQVSL
jgi:D-3-phosphoglycerate dehydrogenase